MDKINKNNFFTTIFCFPGRLRSFSLSFIEKIENLPISFNAWFISFISFIFIRTFLEGYSTGADYLKLDRWPFFFLHSVSFYLFTFLIFILFIHFITKEKIEKVSKASLWLAPWLLLAPVIDFFVFKGKYVSMLYTRLEANNFFDIIKQFYNFSLFGPNGLLQFANKLWGWGDTSSFSAMNSQAYGLKIEVGIIIVIGISYIFIKTSSAIKSIFFLLFACFVSFIFTYFPYLIMFFSNQSSQSKSLYNVCNLNPNFSGNFVVFSCLALLLVILSALWYWRYDKNKFLAIVKNIRLTRLGLYLCAMYYGIYLSAPEFTLNFFDYLLIIMASLAIIFSWLFAVGSNDLADEGGDKISKSYRPLPSGALTSGEIKNMDLIYRIFSYLCALVAGYAFFMTILIRSAISYLYSNQPFRLKKYPIISTFCIACGVLLGVLGGFLLFSEKTFFDFPLKMAWLIIINFTLGMNFIHIEDREGDKKENVFTLPVIFGDKVGRIIIGFLAALSFLATPLIYPEIPIFAFLGFIFLALAIFFVINRNNFKEWLVISIYVMYALMVIFFIQRPLLSLL